MSQQSSFRGIQGIREIKARMATLVAWYEKHKPEVRELVIDRKDYDLIERWPKAADVEGLCRDRQRRFLQGHAPYLHHRPGPLREAPRPRTNGDHMRELTELMARGMTLEELAEALRDHADAAVRVLAMKIISGYRPPYDGE